MRDNQSKKRKPAARRGPGTASLGTAAAQTAAAAATSVGGVSARRERDQRRRRKRRRIIAMIIAECFALALIFGYGTFLRQWNKIQRPIFNEEEVKNEELDEIVMEKMKGYWTIAIFGVDARDKVIANGTNADVNIICNINLDTGEIRLVSVYRDSYLNISKDGSYNKINQAYFLGGPEQAVQALNRNLDLNITDYMTFNWKAVADAINILGGVDVELSKAEFYYINSFITETAESTGLYTQHLKSAGMNHLDGVQAVAYGRLRLMDTDFARTERQRKIIKLAFEKAQHADFETLKNVLGAVFPQVATSINVNDILNSLMMINRYHLTETTGFPQARGDVRMPKKGAVVVPQTLESNVVKLHEFLFGDEVYTPTEQVKQISAKIAADTGLYTEGKYVDHVGTDGGVIQKPKEPQKTAETKKSEESDNTKGSETTEKKGKYATIYVLDEDGKKVKKSVLMETDADGEYIEPKTNAAGVAIGWSLDEDGELVKRETDEYGEAVTETSGTKQPTAAGTDEYGNPVETSGPAPTASGRPSVGETDAYGRPLGTTPTSAATRPGGNTEPTASLPQGPASGTQPQPTSQGLPLPSTPGNPSGTTASPHPTAASTGAAQRPGEGTTPTSPAGPTVSQGPSGTGNGGVSPAPQSPAGNSGPGGNGQPGTNAGTIAPNAGVVSGPGQ